MTNTAHLSHPECRVTAQEQPDLWQLVQDTAARLGVPAPAVIELYPVPDVEASPDRIRLGLPYVLDLPADELAAVIAHELIHLNGHGSDGLSADALVAQVVSPESVAAALVRGSYLSLTFERFVLQYVAPLATAGWYPVDLWTSWRWTLRQDHNRFDLPELAGRVTALLGSPDLPDPAPGVRPVPLRPLGFELEAYFAKCLTEQWSGDRELRAVTFDAAPEEIWDQAATRRVLMIRAAAAELFGHPVILPLHVLELVQTGRAAEILRRCGADNPDLFPVSRVLAPLVVDALRRRGYRFEHVLRQNLWIGPTFDQIDISELVSPLERDSAPSPLLLDILT